MKNAIAKTTSLLVLVLTLSSSTSAMDNLKGSYTDLPDELKPLSLLDGALIRNTELLSTVYQETTPSEEINPPAIKLSKNIFHFIEETGEFRLSDLNVKSMEPLISNLVFLFLWHQIQQKLNSLIKQNKEQTKKIKIIEQAQKTIKKQIALKLTNIGTARKNILFEIPWKTARLIFLSALWEFKQTNDFNYQKLLKEKLLKACEELLKIKPLPPQITELLDSIDEKAKVIPLQKTKKVKTTPSVKTLFNKKLIDQLTDEEFEALAIYLVEISSGLSLHAPIIKYQEGIITIDNKKINFPDCIETTVRNLINLLAFNTKTGMLSLEELQKKTDKELPQQVKDFYTKFPNFALGLVPENATEEQKTQITNTHKQSQKNIAAHDAWAEILSQRKNIKYHEKGYDIEPTWANLIILVNSLLGEPWFNEPTEYPKNPVKFANEHLEKLVALFGTTNIEAFSKENGVNADDPNTTLPIFRRPLVELSAKETKEDSAAKSAEEENEDHGLTLLFTILLTEDHGYLKYAKNTLEMHFSKEALQAHPIFWFMTPPQTWPETPMTILPLYSTDLNNPDLLSELLQTLPAIHFEWFPVIKKYIEDDLDENQKAISLFNLADGILASKALTSKQKEQITNLITTTVQKILTNLTAAVSIEKIRKELQPESIAALTEGIKKLIEEESSIEGPLILAIFNLLAKDPMLDLSWAIPIAIKILNEQTVFVTNRDEYSFFKTILSQNTDIANLILKEIAKSFSQPKGKINLQLLEITLNANTKLQEEPINSIIDAATAKIKLKKASYSETAKNVLTCLLENELALASIKKWLKKIYIEQRTKEIERAGNEILEKILKNNPEDALAEEIILDFLTTETLREGQPAAHAYETYIARLLNAMAFTEKLFDKIIKIEVEDGSRLIFIYKILLAKNDDDLNNIYQKILFNIVNVLPTLCQTELNEETSEVIFGEFDEILNYLIGAIKENRIKSSPNDIAIINSCLKGKQNNAPEED